MHASGLCRIHYKVPGGREFCFHYTFFKFCHLRLQYLRFSQEFQIVVVRKHHPRSEIAGPKFCMVCFTLPWYKICMVLLITAALSHLVCPTSACTMLRIAGSSGGPSPVWTHSGPSVNLHNYSFCMLLKECPHGTFMLAVCVVHASGIVMLSLLKWVAVICKQGA